MIPCHVRALPPATDLSRAARKEMKKREIHRDTEIVRINLFGLSAGEATHPGSSEYLLYRFEQRGRVIAYS